MEKQERKSIFHRWWFWLVIVLFVIGIIGSRAQSRDKNASDSSLSSSQTQSESSNNSASTKPKKQETAATSTKSASQIKEDYIANCVEVAYKDLARNPDNYKGKNIKVTIEVNQKLTGGLFTESGYRGYEDYELDLKNDNSTYLQKEWYISYEIADGESRILANDVVVFYGEYNGTVEMERALTGTKEYVPNLKAKYHKIISD